MQYAKALCCCWQHPCPPHPYSQVYLYWNTITSLSLLVWKGNLIHLKLVNFGVGAPLVWLWIVDLKCVQELIAIKAPHCINGVGHRGDAGVAPGRGHAAHHLPLVPGRVVHLHAVHGVRAVKPSGHKQLSCEGKESHTHCSAPAGPVLPPGQSPKGHQGMWQALAWSSLHLQGQCALGLSPAHDSWWEFDSEKGQSPNSNRCSSKSCTVTLSEDRRGVNTP